MQDREIKVDLLRSGKYAFYQDVRGALFEVGWNVENLSYYKGLSSEEVHCCKQISEAKRKQRNRIKRFCNYWFTRSIRNHDCAIYFATLTFTDEALTKSFEARQKAIQRTLGQFADYVSNVDYAPETGREHYHAIVVLGLEDLIILDKLRTQNMFSKHPKLDNYVTKYGFVKFELVKSSGDKEKLAAYIAKLVAHSLKVRQTKLGYKRDSDYQRYKALHSKLSHLAREKTRFISGKLLEPVNKLYDTIPF